MTIWNFAGFFIWTDPYLPWILFSERDAKKRYSGAVVGANSFFSNRSSIYLTTFGWTPVFYNKIGGFDPCHFLRILLIIKSQKQRALRVHDPMILRSRQKIVLLGFT